MELEVTRAKAFSGLSWIKKGWKIFTLKPAIFMACSAIIMGFTVFASLIPYANFLVLFLSPFLSIGFYQLVSNIEQNEEAQIPDLFRYFSEFSKYILLVRIAAVGFVLSIPALTLASDIQVLFAEQQLPTFSQMLLLAVCMFVQAMVTAFAVPIAWVEPKTPLLTVLKQSFLACWRNAMPLTLFGLAAMVIATVSMPFLIVGWLIAYAVITIGFLQAFLDIYQPVSQDAPGTLED